MIKTENNIYHRIAVILGTIMLAFSIAGSANAAGHWNPVKVMQVGVNTSGVAFVKVDTSTSQATSTPPACSSNGFWQIAFDAKTDAGKAILSMAMSAKLSGQNIRLIGSNTCNAYSTIEDIYVIDLVPDS